MRIFLNQCINSDGLPFKPYIKIPNKETLKAFEEINNGEGATSILEEFEKFLDEVAK